MIKALIVLLITAFVITIITISGVWWWANNAAYKSAVPVLVVQTATSTTSSTLDTIASSTETIATSSTSTVTAILATSSVGTTVVSSSAELIQISEVPFTTQAPNGNWSDPMQQDGCEEASVLMAMYWAKGLSLTKAMAEKEIVAMAQYQQNKYSEYRDTDVYDTVEGLFMGYWQYNKVQIDARLSKAKIIKALANNQLVIVPTNGQLLKNPNFKAPGPLTHMIVIKGYDPAKDQFIANDPGTRKGESYRYAAVVLLNAVVTYPTGYHGLQDITKKSMIIVSKEN